jgi:hypothetical protein
MSVPHRSTVLSRSMRAISYLVPAFVLSGLLASGCGAGALPTGGDDTSGSGSSSSVSTGAGGAGAGGSGGGYPAAALDPDESAIAAVFIASCAGGGQINSLLNTFYTRRGDHDFIQSAIFERLSCFKGKANGCKAVLECLGIYERPDGPCQDGCTGDLLERCNDAVNWDCQKLGLTCSAEKRKCMPSPSPPSCDLSTFQDRCDAGVPVVCGAYEVRGPSCSDYGLTCGSIPNDSVACRGTGAACTPMEYPIESVEFDEGIACDGQRLRACVSGGEALVDCGTLGQGFTCQTGASAFCGRAAECAPSSAGEKTTCEGTSVVLCNAGRIEKIDCTTLGFTGCNATFGVCSPGVSDKG